MGSNQVQSKVCREQDRQCTYNVTLRLVRATIVAVEKQKVLRILSVRTLSLGSTQPLTEMSTRNISWEVKAAGA